MIVVDGERYFEDRTQPEPYPWFKDESAWRPVMFDQEIVNGDARGTIYWKLTRKGRAA